MQYKKLDFHGSSRVQGREIYISGLGSVYDNIDHHNDIVASTAFETYAEKWEKGKNLPLMCLEHQLLKPIGKWLECSSDENGLHLVGKLIDTLPAGKIAINDLLHGHIYGLSIGYQVLESYIREDGVRVITRAKLYEVSIVSQQANEKALINSIYIKTGQKNE